MSFESRNSLLAKVHIAKKALGMEEEAYRDLLEATTGKRSAGALSVRQLVQVVEVMRKRGWSDEDPRPARRKPKARTAPDCRPLLDKVGALLADSGRPWAYATAMLRRMYGVTKLEWAKPEHLRGIIAALTKDAQRQARRAAQEATA